MHIMVIINYGKNLNISDLRIFLCWLIILSVYFAGYSHGVMGESVEILRYLKALK
jgi:hypothetical protein